jgi:hypothetical protein
MKNIQNELIIVELENLAAHFGDWSKSIVLGGGVALILYDRCLAKTSARPVGTTDMDFLIPRKPAVPADIAPLSQILAAQGFEQRTKSLGNPPIESYFKSMGETELEVEFLTDDRSRQKTDSAPIAAAEVVAQPLSYLEMSLQTVTPVRLPRGTEILVVRPEAWVFHKGLTFTRRKSGSAKVLKDLYGIWFVLTMFDDLSVATWKALKALQLRQPAKWRETFQSNLQSWISQAAPRDWQKLIAQDPENRLTEPAFRGLVARLASKD